MMKTHKLQKIMVNGQEVEFIKQDGSWLTYRDQSGIEVTSYVSNPDQAPEAPKVDSKPKRKSTPITERKNGCVPYFTAENDVVSEYLGDSDWFLKAAHVIVENSPAKAKQLLAEAGYSDPNVSASFLADIIAERYKDLNSGMSRMMAGNLIRGALKARAKTEEAAVVKRANIQWESFL